jgi:hypothetical protein
MLDGNGQKAGLDFSADPDAVTNRMINERYVSCLGRRPLGRPRRRWLDNIMMDLVEVGWSDVDWIGLAQDRHRWRALVNSVLNLRVP